MSRAPTWEPNDITKSASDCPMLTACHFTSSWQRFYCDYAIRTTPVGITPDMAWTQVASGKFHSCAIAITGSVYCWGDGGKGQLGLASKDTVRYYASAAPTTSTCCNNYVLDPSVHFVDEARERCDFVDRNRNISDQYIRSRPTLVSQDGQQWTLVSAGAEHTCGITAGAQLMCWGESCLGLLRSK